MEPEETTLPGSSRRATDELGDPPIPGFDPGMSQPCDGDEADPSATAEKHVIRIALADPDELPLVPPTAERRGPRKKPVPEPGGNPAINAPLPRQGVGFRAYKGIETEYGYVETVEFVKTLGAAWADLYKEGPVLQIGDLAVQGGGPTPKMWGHPEKGYHKSHGSGRDFDVQIIAKGNVPQKPRSIEIKSAEYDRERTQALVDLIRQLAGKSFDLVLSADDQLQGIHRDPSHTHHLHVRLK